MSDEQQPPTAADHARTRDGFRAPARPDTRRRRLRTSLVSAALVSALVPLAAACAAGNDAETTQIQPDTAAATAGPLRVQNVVVVAAPTGGQVGLTGAIFNSSSVDDTLQSVSLEGGQPGAVLAPGTNAPSPTGLVIPQGDGAVYIGAGTGLQPSATVLFPGLPPGAAIGDQVKVDFTFAHAGVIRLTTQVMTNQNAIYAHVLPSAPTQPGTQPGIQTTATATPGTTVAPGLPTPTATGTTPPPNGAGPNTPVAG